MAKVEIPKRLDGTNDNDLVKKMYMTSQHIDWTRFCEENEWDNHATRPMFPVRTWQQEKQTRMAIAQGDTIAALMFERQYAWTKDVLAALKDNPVTIDMGIKLAKAQMSAYGHLYNDYLKWIEEGKHFDKQGRRQLHPFEKLDMTKVSKALADLTKAKNEALMIDKWAPKKLDLPKEDLRPADGEGEEIVVGPTIEGGKELTYERMQGWLDRYLDKPQPELGISPTTVAAQPESGKPPPPPETVPPKNQNLPSINPEDQDAPPVIIKDG